MRFNRSMNGSRISIRREDPHSALATRLIAELVAELSRRYAGQEHDEEGSFKPADVTVPRSAFVVARLDGEPVGCGALRPMTAEVAEIKRMYVHESARCLGVGRAIVAELERLAGEFGYGTLKLETGIRQPEAIALYTGRGFLPIPRYGEYNENPTSVCYGKNLVRVGS
jgi:putative acetyltransferase